MHSDSTSCPLVVFDLGGTWFRWGAYEPERGLSDAQRAPAINYLSHPDWSAEDLQLALADFIIERVIERDARTASISVGAPVNAHDMTVLGSGPLWGPAAKPFHLQARLHQALPDVSWHVINDITALLARYMQGKSAYRKTMLITVSSGIGSRLYDHQAQRIPFDNAHGIQGEIGHLVFPFELEGRLVSRQCECGGWNHMNAFASGRGIARTLRELPRFSATYDSMATDSPDQWRSAGDEYRLRLFQTRLEQGNDGATRLLDALVTPLARSLAAALSLDPDIDRIVITGGVVHGLGAHYRQALERTFTREGLYQITERDPAYLTRRLHWDEADDFAGLIGAGLYATRSTGEQHGTSN